MIINQTVSGGGRGYQELPPYEIVNGAAKRRQIVLDGTEFSAITSISSRGMQNIYNHCYNMTGTLSMPNLTTIGTYGLIQGFEATMVSSLSMPSLTTIGDYGLREAFRQTDLSTINLPELTTVGVQGLYYAFDGCVGLTEVRFPKLSSVGGQGLAVAFCNCDEIELYFPALTTSSFVNYPTRYDHLQQMCSWTNVATIHFPSNLQSTISGLMGYNNNFGATSGSILFDLPATN